MKPRTSDLLVDRIAGDAKLQADLQTDPVGTLRQVSQEITTKTPRVMEADVWVYRIIVMALSLFVIIVGVGVLYIAAVYGEDGFIPATISTLAGTALGALAGILMPRGQ